MSWILASMMLLGLLGSAPAQAGGDSASAAFCQGSDCLERLESMLGTALPDTLLGTLKIQAHLRDELFQASQFTLGVEETLKLDALEASTRQCEDALQKAPKIRYGSPEDLEKMCNDPAVLNAKKQYDGVSIPYLWESEKYDRKVAAQKAYHRKVAERLSGLLLARIAVAQTRLDTLNGPGQLTITPLPFPVESCPNAKKGEFTYPYPAQSAQYQHYRETLKQGGVAPDTGSLGSEGIQQISNDLAQSRELLRQLCQNDIVSATADHVQDPRMSMLVFNSDSFDPASPEGIIDQVTFCRYGDIRERVREATGKLTWLYDGLTLGIGFLGPKGMALASVANVGLYGALAGQAYVQAEKLREKFMIGERTGVPIVSEDTVVEAENKLVSTLIEAGIVTGVEAASWAAANPSVRVLGGKLLKLIRSSGGVAQAMAEGSLKVLADGVVLLGTKIPFSDLPAKAVSAFKKGFQYLAKRELAQAAKMNVRALVDTMDEIASKYGTAVAQKFEEYIGRYGRKGLDKYGCRLLTVVGPGASAATWAYQGLK